MEELSRKVKAGLQDSSLSFKNATKLIVEMGNVSGNHYTCIYSSSQLVHTYIHTCHVNSPVRQVEMLGLAWVVVGDMQLSCLGSSVGGALT